MFLKKILISFAAVNLFFFSFCLNAEEQKKYCAFCDPDVIDNQKYYEDELVCVLYTYKPVFPGHSLIIPKRHVERFEELTEKEILHIMRAIKKVNVAAEKTYKVSSYLILQKNGHEVGQTVPHVHFHYIPRKSCDDSIIKFFYKMFTSQIKKPLTKEKIKIEVRKLKENIL